MAGTACASPRMCAPRAEWRAQRVPCANAGQRPIDECRSDFAQTQNPPLKILESLSLSAVGREKAIPKKSGSPKSFPTTPKLHQSRQCTVSALPQSSPNAQGQAGPGEFGPACGEQTHALARTAAAKPGPAWPWALGELWGSALTVHCLLWGSFGVVGKLLGEPDFFGTAFSRPTAQLQKYRYSGWGRRCSRTRMLQQ